MVKKAKNTPRTVLLDASAALKTGDSSQLIALATSKTFDLRDSTTSISRGDLSTLLERTEVVFREAAARLFPQEGEAAIRAPTDLELLHSAAVLANAAISDTTRAISPPLERLSLALHQLLMRLCGLPEASQIVDEILALCEAWWMDERAGREQMVSGALHVLLDRSLARKAKPQDVNRVYQMRDAFTQVNYENENAVHIKAMLLSTIQQPLYLSAPLGRRFLSFLFEIHAPLIEDIHRAIKAQIPYSRKPYLIAYGDVYFNAWKAASGHSLFLIENNCIQDLMDCAVHASTSSMAGSLRYILEGFHSQKRGRHNVDQMLSRLYEPILWRSLKVANQTVRCNAAALLVRAFPLVENEFERDVVIQQQFDALDAIATDASAQVRVVGAEGICRALCLFWQCIPSTVVQALLGRIVNDLCRDQSSSPVRAAAFRGLAYLLDEPLSHAVLKPLLPHLGLLVHDRSTPVRKEVVRLLLLVKGIRDIRFWDIAPVDHLLARLPLEGPEIARDITGILMSTFFRQTESTTEQLGRVNQLLQDNPQAGLVFFSHVKAFAPIGSVCKLARLLYRSVLHSCANELLSLPPAPSPGLKRRASRDVDSADQEEGELRQLESMLEAVDVLWSSISNTIEKPGNEELLDYMNKTVNDDSLTKISSTLAPISEKAQSSLWRIASRVPASLVPSHVKDALPALEACGMDDVSGIASALLDCLGAWGRGGEVASLISTRIKSALEESVVDSKRKRRKVESAVDPHIQHGQIAQALLSKMLATAQGRRTLFDDEAGADAITSSLNLAWKMFRDGKRDEFVGECVSLFIQWSMHVESDAIITKAQGPLRIPQAVLDITEWLEGDVPEMPQTKLIDALVDVAIVGDTVFAMRLARVIGVDVLRQWPGCVSAAALLAVQLAVAGEDEAGVELFEEMTVRSEPAKLEGCLIEMVAANHRNGKLDIFVQRLLNHVVLAQLVHSDELVTERSGLSELCAMVLGVLGRVSSVALVNGLRGVLMDAMVDSERVWRLLDVVMVVHGMMKGKGVVVAEAMGLLERAVAVDVPKLDEDKLVERAGEVMRLMRA